MGEGIGAPGLVENDSGVGGGGGGTFLLRDKVEAIREDVLFAFLRMEVARICW